MSSLWTPDGERRVERDQRPRAASSQADAHQPTEEEPSEEEIRAQMAALREQLVQTPAAVVIANHAFGLFELAALHLSQQPPILDQARLAIDAFGALVEGLAGRLGEAEQQLVDGLAQLRLAFVQISAAAQAGQAGGQPPQ
jgi:hypothetical protein